MNARLKSKRTIEPRPGQGKKRSFRSIRFSSDFRSLKQSGDKIQTYNFLINFRPATQSSNGISRVGLTVSTKIDKRAVARNRMKRLIREALVQLLPNATGVFDLVVIARKNIAEVSLPEVVKELRKALLSHQLIKAKAA